MILFETEDYRRESPSRRRGRPPGGEQRLQFVLQRRIRDGFGDGERQVRRVGVVKAAIQDRQKVLAAHLAATVRFGRPLELAERVAVAVGKRFGPREDLLVAARALERRI